MAFSVERVENGVNAAAAFVCGVEALRVSRHTNTLPDPQDVVSLLLFWSHALWVIRHPSVLGVLCGFSLFHHIANPLPTFSVYVILTQCIITNQ